MNKLELRIQFETKAQRIRPQMDVRILQQKIIISRTAQIAKSETPITTDP
jgi:hypothetical protein